MSSQNQGQAGNPREHRRGAVLPLSDTGNEPCVWMQAKLVAYKLCDRDFDCEHCSFDAAMQGALPLPCTGFVQGYPETDCFPSDRLYARHHVWVQEVAKGQHRVGLDAFAASLLSPVGAAILPSLGTKLEAGQPGCWLADESGPVPVRMPFSGPLIQGNHAIRLWPQLTSRDPYGEGWLLEMDTDASTNHPQHLLRADVIRKCSEEDWISLNKQLDLAQDGSRPRVGPTMQDGGEGLVTLRTVLGPVSYRGLIRNFL